MDDRFALPFYTFMVIVVGGLLAATESDALRPFAFAFGSLCVAVSGVMFATFGLRRIR